MRGDIGGIVDHYCLNFLFITCIHSARFTLSNITFFFSAFAIFHYSIKDLNDYIPLLAWTYLQLNEN